MIVSITRLRIRRWFFLPRFALHTLRIRKQVRASPGFVSGCFALQPGRVFWTVTVWADDAAVRSFRNGGDHARSMRHLMNWCDEASYARFPRADASIPPAETLFERLRDDGKLSKVLWPSKAHEAGSAAGTAPPRLAGRIVPIRGPFAKG